MGRRNFRSIREESLKGEGEIRGVKSVEVTVAHISMLMLFTERALPRPNKSYWGNGPTSSQRVSRSRPGVPGYSFSCIHLLLEFLTWQLLPHLLNIFKWHFAKYVLEGGAALIGQD